MSTSHLRLAVFALVAVYTCGFMLWYSATALGLAPMLDGREQLELATRIANGSLPHEPYYRAALFPALVAWLLKLGVSAQHLPFAVRMLDGGLHLLSSALVWMIAMRVWHSRWSATLAALLFGMNPVVLHFAADPLDLTFAMALMLGGVLATLCALAAERASRGMLVCAATLLSCAMLARPQMVVLLPMLLLLVLVRGEGVRLVSWVLLPMLLVSALMGLANLKVGGAFRVLPWQGAYNLWAANGPDANGRYFVQRERQGVYVEGGNPARIESERLYRRAQPTAPADYASMSRYWQQRTWDYVRAEPQRWLRLLASKSWYLLNDFEQYDIKTYHFHKALSPWLRWNPLSWSYVLAAALAALAMHGRQRAAWRVAGFAVCYAGGLLLGYVSARFRLPLVPLLAVLAGGVLCTASRQAVARGVVVALVVLYCARQALPPGEADRTLVQDYLLSARAAAVLGFDEEALSNARMALARAPGDEAARELLCVASFNAWLRRADYDAPGPLHACQAAASISPVAQRAVGVLYWRQGHAEQARALWRALVDANGEEHDTALAALLLVGDGQPQLDGLNWRESASWSDELLFALSDRGEARAQAMLERRLPLLQRTQQMAALKKLFALPSSE